eukprot:scaffold232137_cov15-Tisochrysis_lutea.AAC.1
MLFQLNLLPHPGRSFHCTIITPFPAILTLTHSYMLARAYTYTLSSNHLKDLALGKSPAFHENKDRHPSLTSPRSECLFSISGALRQSFLINITKV